MGIVQEKRFDAPRPEVITTEHGAVYVKAATETPVADIRPEDATVEEEKVEESPSQPAPAAPADKVAPKKRAGRPKKSNKK